MTKAELCAECGVPLLISRELNWESNGVISLARSPQNRMVLYESRIIDSLFKGIEELIGLPIEHIVIESRRREVRKYIENRFPAEVKQLFSYGDQKSPEGGLEKAGRSPGLEAAKKVTMEVIDIGRIYGYGDSRPGDEWELGGEYPWRTSIIRHPYSLPFWAGEALGSIEAFEGNEQWVKYEETGDDTYRMITYPGSHPIELKERLKRKRFDFKPGDIAFERCSRCGVPVEIARYVWNLEEGTIADPDLERRMAIYTPSSLEAVLDDLEAELGESIPELVIEAQRRFVKSRVSGENWNRSGTTFNRLTALRGLGNITNFDADEYHLSLNIENPCLHLLLVGMAKALYELAVNRKISSHEWALEAGGELVITIRVE